MATRAQIQHLADQIASTFPAVERIILFGSHASGDATRESDVDLLVVMPHEGAGYRMASRIRATIDPGFPVDILVRTPEDIQQRLAEDDSFIVEAIGKGAVLHESQHVRVD